MTANSTGVRAQDLSRTTTRKNLVSVVNSQSASANPWPELFSAFPAQIAPDIPCSTCRLPKCAGFGLFQRTPACRRRPGHCGPFIQMAPIWQPPGLSLTRRQRRQILNRRKREVRTRKRQASHQTRAFRERQGAISNLKDGLSELSASHPQDFCTIRHGNQRH
ncbi:MAG: hypothetical protein FWD68_06735 [Alphaproteobacteria bacterium]|nr:hypothetical protein [Alphaproteobacteria bacterium]